MIVWSLGNHTSVGTFSRFVVAAVDTDVHTTGASKCRVFASSPHHFAPLYITRISKYPNFSIASGDVTRLPNCGDLAPYLGLSLSYASAEYLNTRHARNVSGLPFIEVNHRLCLRSPPPHCCDIIDHGETAEFGRRVVPEKKQHKPLWHRISGVCVTLRVVWQSVWSCGIWAPGGAWKLPEIRRHVL